MNKCEPDALLALPDPTLPNTDFRTISTLSDLCDRELVATIGWAKQIPGKAILRLHATFVAYALVMPRKTIVSLYFLECGEINARFRYKTV